MRNNHLQDFILILAAKTFLSRKEFFNFPHTFLPVKIDSNPAAGFSVHTVVSIAASIPIAIFSVYGRHTLPLVTKVTTCALLTRGGPQHPHAEYTAPS